MRIVFFGDIAHPNASGWIEDLVTLFGVEVHTVDYAAAPLPCPGVHPHLLSPPLGGKARYLVSGAALRRLVRGIDHDLVLAYRVTSYGFAAARAGVRPLVLAGQGQKIVSPESPVGSRFCARYALRRADLLHAWAPHMAAAMEALGADPRRIRVLHRGVRTDIFRPGPSAPTPPVIVTSRQLAPYYRTDLVLRALASLRERGVTASLWIAGEGPDRERLEGIAAELNLGSSVRFLGRLPLEGLAEVYRRSSVYASMVPTDGVSSSLLEAMSSGLLPVVVDNEANRVWIEPRRGGLLVPEGRLDLLVDALASALSPSGPLAGSRERNRALVVESADRRKNLGTMIGWWQDLVASRSPLREARAS